MLGRVGRLALGVAEAPPIRFGVVVVIVAIMDDNAVLRVFIDKSGWMELASMVAEQFHAGGDSGKAGKDGGGVSKLLAGFLEMGVECTKDVLTPVLPLPAPPGRGDGKNKAANLLLLLFVMLVLVLLVAAI